jgi:DUF4097 and DUF4098 domain-containing protein YvlB
MTFRNDDEFTRNLNDRLKELEDMTNEISSQHDELEDRAARAENETTRLDDETTQQQDEPVNQAAAPRQEGETIFFTAKVNADKPLKLNITNNNGDIDVTGTNSDSVEIEAIRQSGEEVDHAHWFFQSIDNEITLRPNWQVGSHVGDLANKLKNQMKEGFNTREWSSKDFRFGLDVNYDLVVRLPNNLAEGSRVSLKNANGDGTLTGVAAEVDFKTANGDLDVHDVAGNLTINSANGDLTATDVAGKVIASTANGDIDLNDIAGAIEGNTANGDVTVSGSSGAVSVRTANGDISITNSTWKGGRLATVAGDITVDAALVSTTTYSFDSVSGEIDLNIRVPGGATFTAKSLTGEVDARGFEKKAKRQYVFGTGNGPRLNAKTVSADITITATSDESLTLIEGEPAPVTTEAAKDSGEREFGGDININLDFEAEREQLKRMFKDLGGKLNSFMGENKPTPPEAPEAPQAPEVPAAPEVPEEVKTATADRRTRLLEAVKNGEMTVDEALAELERDV